MKTMVLEIQDSYYIDREYYGCSEVAVAIVLFSQNEKLTNDELVELFTKDVDISKLKNKLEEYRLLYEESLKHNNVEEKKQIKSLQSKKSKLVNGIRAVKDLGVDTAALNKEKAAIEKEISSLKSKVKSNENKNSKLSDQLYALEDEIYELDFHSLTNSYNVRQFFLNKDTLDIKRHVFKEKMKEFIQFLVNRDWQIIDTSNSINADYAIGQDSVTLKELYEDIDLLKIKKK